jgi:hypothetical protein
MIVWGGRNYGTADLNDGAGTASPRTWTPIATAGALAAIARFRGLDRLTDDDVWGVNGTTPLSRGVVRSATNTWTPLTPPPHPPRATPTLQSGWRVRSRLGRLRRSNYLNSGRATSATGVRLPISSTGAPDPRAYRSAVRQASNVIVWGGENGSGPLATGARFTPPRTRGRRSRPPAPSARSSVGGLHGQLMVVWGGQTSSSDALSRGPLQLRAERGRRRRSEADLPPLGAQAVWTGSRMIIGGAWTAVRFQLGRTLRPLTDAWTPTSAERAGSWLQRLLGLDWPANDRLGRRRARRAGSPAEPYDPIADAGGDLDRERARGAPATAVWTGRRMIVWGGRAARSRWRAAASTTRRPIAGLRHRTSGRPKRNTRPSGQLPDDRLGQPRHGVAPSEFGGVYDPRARHVARPSLIGADGRYAHTANWTGDRMLVWAGYDTSR